MAGNPQLVVPIPGTLALGMECDEVLIEQPAGIDSNLVIDAPPAPDWRLKTRFRMGGTSANGFHSSNIPGEVIFYLEGFGSSTTEIEIPGQSFHSGDGNPLGGKVFEYEVSTADQPANLLPEGPYRITAIARFPGWAMTAFLEGPLVQQAGP